MTHAKTTLTEITIAGLIAARDASLSPDCGSSALVPADLPLLDGDRPWAGLLERSPSGRCELIDGHHRTSGLQRAVADGRCSLSDMVPVVITTDSALIDAVIEANDFGESVGAVVAAAVSDASQREVTGCASCPGFLQLHEANRPRGVRRIISVRCCWDKPAQYFVSATFSSDTDRPKLCPAVSAGGGIVELSFSEVTP